MIHARTLQSIEFYHILKHLANLCISSAGRERALTLRPLTDAASVTSAAHLYEEAQDWVNQPSKTGTTFTLNPFPDISGLLNAARSEHLHSFSPDIEAFWALREVVCLAREAHNSIVVTDASIRWPHLLKLAEETPLPSQLIAALVRCISDDGLLRDESSPELYRLRGELRRLHQNCLRKVKDFGEKYNMMAYLQDDFITLSSDRYVLPLKANFKGRMQGIIHDWSQTGETCYFEPMFLVEINNHLQQLKREEREEERKVLLYLRSILLSELPGACAAFELLAQLDVLQASRSLAAKFDGRMLPITTASEGICLLHSRHPLLLLNHLSDTNKKQHAEQLISISNVRPLDIILRPGERALIITGGNAGGKTVCLKTLGLITAMTLSGLPVPAAPGSHLPWFKRMDAFIGDEQSLTDNVSTFTAQIEHLGKAWKYFNDDALILLDEFGAGTDPAQGAALAQAVLDELLNKNAFVLAVTHFPALKNYALTHDNVRAASMLFDPNNRKPLFKLAYNQVGSSLALDVAREYGLPEEVLLRARHYLLQDVKDTTPIIERLNALAVRREEELAKLAKEQEKARRQTEMLRKKLDEERSRLQNEIRSRISELVSAWRDGKLKHKQTVKELSSIRASLLPEQTTEASSVLPEVDSFSLGQNVLHVVFNKRGVITDIDHRRRRVRLDMQGVTLWAAMKDVRMPSCPPSLSSVRKKCGFVHSSPGTEKTTLMLDLRGQRAEIALSELEHFIDNALLNGFVELEIVHGRGTGVLRKQVHDFLRSFPSVEHFSTAPEDRGGDGMTIVRLR